jgi:hypothetical protein
VSRRVCTFRHPPSARRHHEAGEFGEAILQCAEAFQLLDGPLVGLTAAPQLRARAQRHYLDSLQCLDAALLRCCAAFSAEGYSKVRRARTPALTPLTACGDAPGRYAQHARLRLCLAGLA